MTVVFCDLVDSVGLSQAVDAEELREIIRAYQRAVEAAVERYDGHIAQFLGDGILMYFGYPVAHDDEAERAVNASLGAVEAVKALNDELKLKTPIRVRLGVHTGVGVMGAVGGAGKREQLVVGSVPNIAARIQGIAEPNQVVISEQTLALVDGLFEFEPAREVMLKGVTRPVRVATALKASGLSRGIEVEVRRGLRPLIDREVERQRLAEVLARAQAGDGSTVMIIGAAGVGKSRLVHSFLSSLPAGTLQLRGRCSQYTQNTPLLPFVDIYGQLLGLAGRSSDAQKIAQHLQQHAISAPNAEALLGSFLSVSTAGGNDTGLSPFRERQQTLELLKQLILKEAAQKPIVICVEDLHWADPSTLEFLGSISSASHDTALLQLVTARPSFESPWAPSRYFELLELPGLSAADAGRVIDGVAGKKPLPPAVRKELLAKADGVPLYLEEMTKSLLESELLREQDDQFVLNVPATLRDSLVARLDRLGPAKEIAQLAAVIGRQFSYELLAALAGVAESTLRMHLQRLRAAELIARDDEASDESYVFSHALIRDAAYDSLLRKRRRQIHQQLADELKARFAEAVRQRPELVAWHLEGSERSVEAISAWQQAGISAQARAANHEAIAHFRRALKLLAREAEGPLRDQQELQLQFALGISLGATQGWASTELSTVYTRAHHLCDALGNPPMLFGAVAGLYGYHLVCAHHDEAERIAESLRPLAPNTGKPYDRIKSCQFSGHCNILRRCNYREALEFAKEGLALFDLEQERQAVVIDQQSASIALRDIAGMSLWALGYPSQAREHTLKALELGRELGSNPCLAWATASVVWGVGQLRRETELLIQCVDETLRLASLEDFSFWPPLVSMFGAATEVDDGNLAAVDRIREGLNNYRAIGAGVLCTTGYARLAQALLTAERHDEGLEVVEDGLSFVETSAEHHYECELHRIKGELLAAEARRTGSLDGFRAALESIERASTLAAASHARSFELRAAMAGARVSQGKPNEREALEQLREIHAWFSEGFDTRDLQEAAALLG
jgi:class 3 adenylate cyclase